MHNLELKWLRAYASLFLVSGILLLILLGAFQSIWMFGGSETNLMTQIGLQRMRSQRIAKDALLLITRQVDERAQATGELQITLPVFEQTQMGLRTGDTMLQLPSHVPDDIQLLLMTAQSDFAPLDTAARSLIAHPDAPADPVQVDIILAHEYNYLLTMSRVNDVWQQRIDSAFMHLYWIETGFVVALVALWSWQSLFVRQSVFKRLVIVEGQLQEARRCLEEARREGTEEG